MRRLHEELGINAANVISGRGQGVVKSIGYGSWVEVDLLSVSVPADKADDVFWFIHEAGGIDTPGGGMLIQVEQERVTRFELPEMAEET